MKVETREEYEREYNIIIDVFKDSNELLVKNLLQLDNSFIKSLEQQNTALQAERTNMLKTHQDTISSYQKQITKLEAQLALSLCNNKRLESELTDALEAQLANTKQLTCDGCKHLFEHTMQCMNDRECERIISLGKSEDLFESKGNK